MDAQHMCLVTVCSRTIGRGVLGSLAYYTWRGGSIVRLSKNTGSDMQVEELAEAA